MNSEQIARSRQILTEIRVHLKKNAYAVRDDRALDQLRFSLNLLKAHDHYIAEKCGDIESLAADFWSARKHQRYRGGPPEILAKIDDLLGRIENQLVRREQAIQTQN
jgi:hypothetical protein